ncbi:ATPase [Kordiimonas sediminis]|uniref:ATPase n=1 Tax=Kordiimonas sediminis TaxID=1735581 RepID=A0A919E5H9_9PROT|nr:ATP-binding protein [Kordiimonas sediminis]GHF15986.1 ATPase [Kordiimonas sediminis]
MTNPYETFGSQTAPVASAPVSQGHAIATVYQVSASGLTAYVSQENLADDTLSSKCRIGSTVKVLVEGRLVYGLINNVLPHDTGAILLEIDFLGELHDETFSRGVQIYPMPGATVLSADETDLATIYAPVSDETIKIGTIAPTHTTVAGLTAEALLSKHFAILGSTGTGKSSTLALTVHRIVELYPAAHVVILDPHNEYEQAFSTNGIHLSTENLALPYWLMNFEEHIEMFVGHNTEGREEDVDILRRSLLEARKRSNMKIGVGKITVDTPVPYKLSDLLALFDDEMGKLNKAESVKPFLRLIARTEELRNDLRFSFMFSGLLVQDSMHTLMSKLLRFPVDGRPVTTLDLSGVPTEIVDVVVSLVSRIIFDFSLWSHKNTGATPVLLICEEAHRYVPHVSSEMKIHAARKNLERIAKEGRKYGVSLGLVSQRPSDLSEAVLSQCGTILSMRMNNERDRRYVEAAMPEGSKSFLSALPSLQNRECIVAGEGVGCPVRVRLDYLDKTRRPASDDPEFSHSWRNDTSQADTLMDNTIRLWRRGGTR